MATIVMLSVLAMVIMPVALVPNMLNLEWFVVTVVGKHRANDADKSDKGQQNGGG